METAVRIETPVKMEMSAQMIKTSGLPNATMVLLYHDHKLTIFNHITLLMNIFTMLSSYRDSKKIT